jgi:uncharacterized membrane protein YgdD (TMEM256/DUF423 family)
MDRAFLVMGGLLGLIGVALGAFGTHALRARVPAERLATFETGVRYQLWHALALLAVAFVRSVGPLVRGASSAYTPLVLGRNANLFGAIAGWLFVAGVVLFSGSLYALALTGERRWGMVAPAGGLCLLAGWACVVLAALTV